MIVNITGNDVNLIDLDLMVKNTNGSASADLQVYLSLPDLMVDFPNVPIPLVDNFYGCVYQPAERMYCVLFNNGEHVECKESFEFSQLLTWINNNEEALKQYAINLRVKELDSEGGL